MSIHRSPVRPRLTSFMSILVLTAMLLGMMPSAARAARPAPPAPPAGPRPVPPAPQALAARPAPQARGISDLTVTIAPVKYHADGRVLAPAALVLRWMTDRAYQQTVRTAATNNLAKARTSASISSVALSDGRQVHTAVLPDAADLRFYQIRAADPATGKIVMDTPVQPVSLPQPVPAATALTPHASHGKAAAATAHASHAHLDQTARAAAAQRWPGDTLPPEAPVCPENGAGFPRGVNTPDPVCDRQAGNPIRIADDAKVIQLPTLMGSVNLWLLYSSHFWRDKSGSARLGAGAGQFGWTISWVNRQLWEMSAYKISLLKEGNRYSYDWVAADKLFRGEPGNNTTIQPQEDGTYILRYLNGDRDVYAADGALLRFEPRGGDTVTVDFTVENGVGIQRLRSRRGTIQLRHTEEVGTGGTRFWRLTRIQDEPTPGVPVRAFDLEYNTTGQLSRVVGASGYGHAFRYDAQGRLTQHYDPANDPTRVGAAARATTITYLDNHKGPHRDMLNYRVVREVMPNGTTLDVDDPLDDPTKPDQNYSSTVRFIFNQGRPDERVETYGAVYRQPGLSARSGTIGRIYLPNSDQFTSYTYDEAGNLTRTVDPLGRTTTYVYSPKNLLLEKRVSTSATPDATDAPVDLTTYTYDDYGHMTSMKAPSGEVTNYGYEPTTGHLRTIHRVAQVPDSPTPVTHTTTFETNPWGQVTAVIGAHGVRHEFTYDNDRGYPQTTIADANGLRLTTKTTYDARGYLRSSTDVRGVQTTYEYESPFSQETGQPSAIVVDSGQDGQAVRTEYTYDPVGNLVKHIADVGEGRANVTTRQTYARVGTGTGYAPTEQIDALGQVVRYGYTAYGALASVTQDAPQAGQGQRTTRLEYTPQGWLERTVLHDGRSLEHLTYNAAGQVVQATALTGRELRFAYDPKGRVERVTEGAMRNLAAGQSARQSSTLDGQVAARAVDGRPDGRARNLSVAQTTASEQPWWEVDLGSVQHISRVTLWPGSGGPAAAQGPLYVLLSSAPMQGTLAELLANPAVQKTVVPGTLGTRREVDFAASGQRYVRIQAADTASTTLGLAEVAVWGGATPPASTQYTYDGANRVVRVREQVDAGATRTVLTRSFDGFGRLSRVTDGAGRETRYTYDRNDRLVLQTVGAQKLAEQVQTEYVYDALDRLTAKVVDPGQDRLNLTTRYDYTAQGSSDRWTLQRITDPNKSVLQHRYNALGQLVQVTDAAGSVWRYDFSRLGDLLTITPPTGAPSTYGYDALGHQTSLTRAGRRETWEYHPDGTLAAYRDAGGQRTTWQYDVVGQLTRVDYSGTPDDPHGHRSDAAYTYTAGGGLASATSRPNGQTVETTTYGYDLAGRLSTRARAGAQVRYGYNLAGDRTSLTYPSGGQVTYGYGPEGALDSITPWNAGQTTYTYLASGLLSTLTRPAVGGTQRNETTYGYDGAARLTNTTTTAQGVVIDTLVSKLDANGNVTDKRGLNQPTQIHSYDALSRLLEGPPGSLPYDAVGNRRSATWHFGGLVSAPSAQGRPADPTGATGRPAPSVPADPSVRAAAQAPADRPAPANRPAPTVGTTTAPLIATRGPAKEARPAKRAPAPAAVGDRASASTTALLARAKPVTARLAPAPVTLPAAVAAPLAAQKAGGILENSDFSQQGWAAWSNQPWGAPFTEGLGPDGSPAISIGSNSLDGARRQGIGQRIRLEPGQLYQLQATGMSTTGTNLDICVAYGAPGSTAEPQLYGCLRFTSATWTTQQARFTAPTTVPAGHQSFVTIWKMYGAGPVLADNLELQPIGESLLNGDFSQERNFWNRDPWGAPGEIVAAGPDGSAALELGAASAGAQGRGQPVVLQPGATYQLSAAGRATPGAELGICAYAGTPGSATALELFGCMTFTADAWSTQRRRFTMPDTLPAGYLTYITIWKAAGPGRVYADNLHLQPVNVTPTVGAEEMLLNGGFEQSTTTDTTTDTAVWLDWSDGTAIPVAQGAHSGTWALALPPGAGGANRGRGQPVALQPNTDYLLRGQIKLVGRAKGQVCVATYAQRRITSSACFTLDSTNAAFPELTGYHEDGVVFRTPASLPVGETQVIWLTQQGGAGTVYVDDLELRPWTPGAAPHNGSFDQGGSSWSGSGRVNPAVQGRTTVLELAGAGQRSQVVQLQPSTHYQLRVWGHSPQASDAQVCVGWVRPSGAREEQCVAVGATDGWREQALTVAVPADSAWGDVVIRQKTGGVAYVDEVRLEPIVVGTSLLNGDFEAAPDERTAWSSLGNSRVATDGPAHSGQRSLLVGTTLNGQAGAGGVRQPIVLRPNTTYRLSAWAQGTSGTAQVCLQAAQANGTVTPHCLTFTGTAGAGYQPKSVDITTPATVAAQGAVVVEAAGPFRIDDIALVAVNEHFTLENAGFEQGLSLWQVWGAAQVVPQAAPGTTRLVLAGADSGAQQRLAVEPSSIYQIGAWSSTTGSVSGWLCLEMTVASQTAPVLRCRELDRRPAGVKTFQFETPADVVSAKMSISYPGGNGAVEVDDVTLTRQGQGAHVVSAGSAWNTWGGRTVVESSPPQGLVLGGDGLLASVEQPVQLQPNTTYELAGTLSNTAPFTGKATGSAWFCLSTWPTAGEQGQERQCKEVPENQVTAQRYRVTLPTPSTVARAKATLWRAAVAGELRMSDVVLSMPDATLIYDGADRIANAGYLYSASGDLLRKQGPEPSAGAAREGATYTYDGAHRLQRRVTFRSGVGSDLQFAYDALGNLLRHRDAQSEATTELVYDESSSIPVVLSERVQTGGVVARTVEWAYGAEGVHSRRVLGPDNAAGVPGQALLDRQGGLRGMIDPGSNQVGSLSSRNAWGSVGQQLRGSPLSGAYGAMAGGYGGSYQAAELTFTPHRVLDRDLGRWLQRDPLDTHKVSLGDPRGANRYVYANNNPATLIDPRGQFAIIPVAVAIASAATGIAAALHPDPVGVGSTIDPCARAREQAALEEYMARKRAIEALDMAVNLSQLGANLGAKLGAGLGKLGPPRLPLGLGDVGPGPVVNMRPRGPTPDLPLPKPPDPTGLPRPANPTPIEELPRLPPLPEQLPPFVRLPTKNGGGLWVSTKKIDQRDFADIVRDLSPKRDITVLTGSHGFRDGSMVRDGGFFTEDLLSFGNKRRVNVVNVNELSNDQVREVINGSGCIIAAWCNSRRSKLIIDNYEDPWPLP